MKEKTIYALGFFDGVHIGHRELLNACNLLANHLGCRSGAVTFSTHPDALVLGSAPKLINTPRQRRQLLADLGITEILELPFDKALMNMPWQDFLQGLVAQGARGFICGEDFRFGCRGEGNARLLEEFCKKNDLAYAIIPPQMREGITVSSTYIRKLIEAGDMEQAVAFLGHPHYLSGTVISGRKLGRTLGIPTANIALPEGVVCPRHGVYACKAIVEGKEYLAVTNIGNRPTVGGHHTTVEPWLLDFEGDLYGKKLTLAFYSFLRPEETFPSLEALKAEIQKNAVKVREFFEKT